MLLAGNVGLQDPLGEVRARCVRELESLLREGDGVDRVVIVTGRDPAPRHRLGPLGSRIGRELLARAGWTGAVAEIAVPFDAGADEIASAASGIPSERTLLLVVADGSAKRTEKAPGSFDERAEAADARLLGALESGDADALLNLDPDLCAELSLTGRAALQVLGTAFTGQRPDAELIWAGIPFGVQYVIARWSPRP